jgi:hypothetical protein
LFIVKLDKKAKASFRPLFPQKKILFVFNTLEKGKNTKEEPEAQV